MKLYSKTGIKNMLNDLPQTELRSIRDSFSDETISQTELESLGETVFEKYRGTRNELKNAPISWEMFKKAMMFVAKQERFETKLYDLIRESRDVVGDAEGPMFQSAFMILSIFEELFEDRSEYITTLEWFVYESCFGEKEDVVNEPYEDAMFPEGSEFRNVRLDNLNTLYRYLCITYANKTGG